MNRGLPALSCLLFVALVGLGSIFWAVPAGATDIAEDHTGAPLLSDAVTVGTDLLRAAGEFLAQGGTDLAAPAAAATGGPDKAVVRFYLFYSDTCPHCHDIMENFLPTVYEKYGDQVEYQYLNINNNAENYGTMLGLETKLGVPQDEQGYIPALVIGDKMLIGAQDIPDKLEGYIDDYLAQGGVDWASLENLPAVAAPTSQPVVQILVFFAPDHADFDRLSSLMSSLGEQYGSRLQALVLDVSQSANADKIGQLNRALGVREPASGTPEVLIDRRLLVGMAKIEADLPGLIDDYLSHGGVAVLSWEELIGGATSATPTTPAATTISATATSSVGSTPAPKPIYLAFFEQAGCQECARTTYDLQLVQEQYPQVVVESFEIGDQENKALNEWLSEKYGVPEQKRLSTPMIFVGQDVLIGSEANASNLLAAVARYTSTGTERVWADFDQQQGEQGLVDRFKSFGVLTVLGAGLIDGLNPCAFATLVFFISYLTFTGRRGRDILLVGLAFTVGVFATYLLVGVGLLRVVQSLSFFTALGRWVYLVTALLCMMLAVLTFRDVAKAREGKAGEMALKLPMVLRRRIHKVIRENAQVRAFVVTALVTGFVVSLLELACTGQVYLPTILFVMSVPELASRAFLYLLLYCLVFILPLVAVFALSYLGTTSEQLGRLVNRHTATIKLLTGLLFVGLALWMTWTLAPLFGIQNPWNLVLLGGVLALMALAVAVWQIVDKRPSRQPVARRRRGRA